MKRLALFILCVLCASARVSLAALPISLRWEVETSRPASYAISLYRGESIYLEPRYLSYGTPLDLSSILSVEFRYRSADMAADTYYRIVADLHPTNVGRIRIPWTPTNETPASAFTYGVWTTTPTGEINRCFGTLKLRGTIQGANTNTPEVVHGSVDWALVDHFNLGSAPFVTTIAWAASNAALRAQIDLLSPASIADLSQRVDQVEIALDAIPTNGVPGPQGPAGPAGSNGVAGAVGPQGPAGSNGVAGAVGPQGPAGSNGVDGAVGLQGPAGPAGSNGVAGAVGPQGPAGSNGVAGAVGPQGPAGTTDHQATTNRPGDSEGYHLSAANAARAAAAITNGVTNINIGALGPRIYSAGDSLHIYIPDTLNLDGDVVFGGGVYGIGPADVGAQPTNSNTTAWAAITPANNTITTQMTQKVAFPNGLSIAGVLITNTTAATAFIGFSAYATNGNVSVNGSGTQAALQFQAEWYDTSNLWNPSTSVFVPNTTGVWEVGCSATFASGGFPTQVVTTYLGIDSGNTTAVSFGITPVAHRPVGRVMHAYLYAGTNYSFYVYWASGGAFTMVNTKASTVAWARFVR